MEHDEHYEIIKEFKVNIPLSEFSNYSQNKIKFKMRELYPDFIKAGIADKYKMKTVDNTIFTVSGEEVKIRNIYADNNKYCFSGKVPIKLSVGKAKYRRIDSYILKNLDNIDYLCFIRTLNMSAKDFAVELLFIKPSDIEDYICCHTELQKGEFVDTVHDIDENFYIETHGMKADEIPEEMKNVYLCKGVNICTCVFENVCNYTELRLNAYVAKKLPNSRHFKWSTKKGLEELCDNHFRPELHKNEPDIYSNF